MQNTDKPQPQALSGLAALLETSAHSDWRRLEPENALYLDIGSQRVVIELAPGFAPRNIENLKLLVRNGFFDGLAVTRVQDNYVVQWGDPDAEDAARRRDLGPAAKTLEMEFDWTGNPDIAFCALPDQDVYAPQTGFVDGFPVGRDGSGRMWLLHTYGAVGIGRDTAHDSGNGSELYAVIGHAPRQLDRNVTLIGRVRHGMSLLSSLPRGEGEFGFYDRSAVTLPEIRMQLAADLPACERIALEILRTETPFFETLIESRRTRSEAWFATPGGHIDIGNVPLPVRLA